MIRIACICCSKCKWCIAEIRVKVEEGDGLVPQVAEMKQSFGIPPFYCEKCIEEEANNE